MADQDGVAEVEAQLDFLERSIRHQITANEKLLRDLESYRNILFNSKYLYSWNDNPQVNAVFKIMPVLPPEADKNLCGRTEVGPSPSCRTGNFQAIQ